MMTKIPLVGGRDDETVQVPAITEELSAPLLRDAVVQAAIRAGDGDLVEYLRRQAEKHPSAFLTLLGKVLPMQLTGTDGELVKTRIAFEIVDPVGPRCQIPSEIAELLSNLVSKRSSCGGLILV